MRPVLIICTGRAPANIRARHGDFPHWFRRGFGLRLEQVRVVDVAAGEAPPAPRDVVGVIITGSASMITERADWSEVLGGRVDYLPGGREIGTQPITASAEAAGDHLALPATFRAHTTHKQSVIEPPANATILARSFRDAHQVLRYGARAVRTQFHPEFSTEIIRAYITRKHADMQREGMPAKEVFNAIAATPLAPRLLLRFAQQHGWIDATV